LTVIPAFVQIPGLGVVIVTHAGIGSLEVSHSLVEGPAATVEQEGEGSLEVTVQGDV
jgi:hypothetical protein